MLVAINDSRQNLLHRLSGHVLVEMIELSNLIEQFTASAQLRDNVKELIVLVELEYLDDIGVIL
jgi:uncharacterized protein YjiS (DUF1127 family)